MAFSRNFLDEVKARSDIEEIIGGYVNLKRAGSNLSGLCPFHNEKTPSFTVFPQTDSYYCFGCGAGGDVFSFIMAVEGLDYPSAVEFLAKRAGIPIEEDNTGYRREENSIKKERIIQMNTDAARLFHAALNAPGGEKAMEYLVKVRGFEQKTIRHFGIGYSPGRNYLYNNLKSKGYTDEEMKVGFLCGISKKGYPYDVFRNRIMFPIFNLSGEVCAFSGRRLEESDERKYVNTSDTPAFKKSKTVFGLNFAKKSDKSSLIICEGQIDTISLHQAGFDNAVATQGTAITPEQVKVISRFTKKVYLAYDGDGAGRTATLKAIDMFLKVGISAGVIDLGPNVKDPDEFIKKNGVRAFAEKIDSASGQVDFRINQILSSHNLEIPDEKIKAADELAELIANEDSRAAREVYLERAAKLISLSEDALREQILRKIKRNEKKSAFERQKRTVDAALGTGDSYNKSRITYAAGAVIEERLLGCMVSNPEDAAQVCKILGKDDLLSDFAKKVYTVFEEEFTLGQPINLSKNGILTQEEISKLASFTAERNKTLNLYGDEALMLAREIKARSESEKLDSLLKENSPDAAAALDEYIKMRKKKIGLSDEDK